MVRIVCEQCKELGYLQVLGNYCRIRHYDKIIDGKSTFHYHQISRQYAEKCLSEIKDKTDVNSEKPDNESSVQVINTEHLQSGHLNLGLESENKEGRSSSSWLGRKPSKLVIPGSNPGDRTKHLHFHPSRSYLKN